MCVITAGNEDIVFADWSNTRVNATPATSILKKICQMLAMETTVCIVSVKIEGGKHTADCRSCRINIALTTVFLLTSLMRSYTGSANANKK